ncbi:PEP-CTERM sorting domain-containing protein [Steroidobacter flavus]|uniref:PEP-CTERM sorting domain-containing protein n=1 Tax=Steroidobacter flavus TaxID=1842136 RepID=A0ABV8SKH0_9GAMM
MSARHGKIRTSALLGLAIATCLASAANATIIYTGPTTYVINTTVTDNIIVNNSAAVLNVQSGGVVQGVNDPTLLGAVRTQAGTLNVSGNGRIEAGVGQEVAISMRGQPATVRLSDQATVNGNVVMDYTVGTHLIVQNQATINGNVRYAGYIDLHDQGRINGNIVNAENGSIRLNMTGGEVAGAVSFGGLNDYAFNMSGGAILGGFRGAAGLVDLSMTGGYIANGFRTGDDVDGTISGGKIDGGMEFYGNTSSGSSLDVTGGRFDTVAGDYLFSMSNSLSWSSSAASLDIFGGQWGYNEAGLGFFFDDLSNFSVTGWDLTFVNGLLSGYLLDGNWFSNRFTFGTDWTGTFTINNVPHNVPEPGTLGLLLASAAGMMFARRRREAATS